MPKNRTKTANLFKVFVVFVSLLLLLYVAVRIVLTFVYQKIDDPIEFALSNQEKLEATKKPKLVCKFFALNCEGMEYYASPLFPYIPIKTEDVVEEKCEKKFEGANYRLYRKVYLRIDVLWGIFWIESQDCGFSYAKVFGPYRLPTGL